MVPLKNIQHSSWFFGYFPNILAIELLGDLEEVGQSIQARKHEVIGTLRLKNNNVIG